MSRWSRSGSRASVMKIAALFGRSLGGRRHWSVLSRRGDEHHSRLGPSRAGSGARGVAGRDGLDELGAGSRTGPVRRREQRSEQPDRVSAWSVAGTGAAPGSGSRPTCVLAERVARRHARRLRRCHRVERTGPDISGRAVCTCPALWGTRMALLTCAQVGGVRVGAMVFGRADVGRRVVGRPRVGCPAGELARLWGVSGMVRGVNVRRSCDVAPEEC